MRSFLLVFLLLLAPALYLYSAENPPSPQRQTNLPANQSLGDDPPVTVELLSLRLQHRAEQGDVEAQYLIALRYGFGLGVAQDYVEARKWYLKAAEQGEASAQTSLGVMYDKGEGVPQDYVQAHVWFNLAASRLPPGKDRDQSVKNRDIVAAKMTPADVSKAQRLAREWKPKKE